MSKVQTVQLNLRVPAQAISDLDHLAQEERLARVDLARKILLEGVAQRKRDWALRLYREGKVSKSRAAEMAGISLWEMVDLVAEAELPATYTLAEAVEDIRRLVASLGSQATSA